eukprot:6776797-Lingulodinium_polyedra.AAC.1
MQCAVMSVMCGLRVMYVMCSMRCPFTLRLHAPRHALARVATFCHATPRHAMPGNAMSGHAMVQRGFAWPGLA